MQAKLVNFPSSRAKAPAERPHKQKTRPIRDFPYFNQKQIKLMRRTVRDACNLARQKRGITAVREWMLIDLLTSTGLRSAEAADLRCGDIRAAYGQSALFVRDGKGSKPRTVQIPGSLKTHLNSFIKWKQAQGEPTNYDDHVFLGQRGAWTPAAVQQVCKKWIRKLDLDGNGISAHALRHSYAVELYRQNKDIRAVQKQLGHSSIQTTQIYADVLAEDIQNQVKGLWN